MNKIASFIIIAGFCAVFSTATSAQQSPFKSCSFKNEGPSSKITCTIIENGTIVEDVVINRNNCKNAKVALMEHNAAKNTMKFSLADMGFGRPYNFGQVAEIWVAFSMIDMTISKWTCPNIIETTIITNKGNWTFTW